ncbi:MAG: Smr/MutS family protein [Chromatiales bacterium]|jgi:DNA-nicking Smr family endonuclease
MSGTNGNGNGEEDKDDLADFLREMADVEPLKKKTAEPWKKRLRPEPLPRAPEEDEHDFADRNIETPQFLEFRRDGIQHRTYNDLRRGIIEPEATLDLHGLRVLEARKALAQFLARSTARGRRCVRIIHGKGRGSSEQPILKQKINQWLPQRQEVLAFTSAPRWDGGTGAVYVLLSRKFRDEY